MYSGAQLSLYPMSDDYVGIILRALRSFGPPDGHVALDLTVSANSPTG